MSEAVKISALELENVKRVRALTLEPTADGLTVIGGRNGQGKTSVLDAIAWALGGNRKRPDRPTREGSATPAQLRVTLSNGIVVERKGKNGALTVTDPEGRRGGQALLDGLVEDLAIDLPRFMAMTDREKANELLRVVGIGEKLDRLALDVARREPPGQFVDHLDRIVDVAGNLIGIGHHVIGVAEAVVLEAGEFCFEVIVGLRVPGGAHELRAHFGEQPGALADVGQIRFELVREVGQLARRSVQPVHHLTERTFCVGVGEGSGSPLGVVDLFDYVVSGLGVHRLRLSHSDMSTSASTASDTFRAVSRMSSAGDLSAR